MTPNYTAVKVNNDKITFTTYAQAVRSEGPVEKVDEITLYQVDRKAPTLRGVEDTMIEKDATFDPMAGVSATDNLDGDIDSASIKVSGNVDPTKVGTYRVTYRVTDKAGNTATVVRDVTVVEKGQTPTPPPSPSGSATPSPSVPATPIPSRVASVPSVAPTPAPASTVATGGSTGEGPRPVALPRTGA